MQDDLPLWFGDADGCTRHGAVTSVSGHTVSISVPGVFPGAAIRIERAGHSPRFAEVTAVHGNTATCRAITALDGVRPGAPAASELARVTAFVGSHLLGADADAWGRSPACRPGRVAAPVARDGERAPVTRALPTGVPAIDAFATLGYGQRIALVAGAGVGKTTLLRRLVQFAQVDACVVALIGERGREAAEFIAELRRGRASRRITTVCATSDRSAPERMTAMHTASAHAQALAADGLDVLLVVDSLTRVATAWRELAVAFGEPLAQRGHPSSLGSLLAATVERAGAFACGSITAVYAVLVEGDDHTEPVTDAARALLDGHIVLSRTAADAGRFPAIDVLRSLSRLMPGVVNGTHRADAACVRRALAMLEEADDLFAIGAYKAGSDHRLDAAVAERDAIEALIFSGDRVCSLAQSVDRLSSIAKSLRRSSPAEL